MTARVLPLAAVAAALALIGAGCGGGGRETQAPRGGPAPRTPQAAQPIERDPDNRRRPVVVLGAQNFPSQALLAQLYAGALRAAGYRVRTRAAFGSEQAAFASLRSRRLDAYPAYLGSALRHLGQPVPRRAGPAYARLQRALAPRGLRALAPAPFEDAVGFAMTRKGAEGARRLSDLRSRAGDLTLAGPPGCRVQPDCAPVLARAYGLRFDKLAEVPVARRYTALANGRADVSSVFTADGALARGGYVLLADDRDALPPYNVTLLLGRRALDAAGPDLPEAVRRLQATLTQPVVQELNRRVDRGAGPARVAGEHLRAAGLVAPGG